MARGWNEFGDSMLLLAATFPQLRDNRVRAAVARLAFDRTTRKYSSVDDSTFGRTVAEEMARLAQRCEVGELSRLATEEPPTRRQALKQGPAARQFEMALYHVLASDSHRTQPDLAGYARKYVSEALDLAGDICAYQNLLNEGRSEDANQWMDRHVLPASRPMLKEISGRLSTAGFPAEDAYSSACVGVLMAVMKFDPDRGPALPFIQWRAAKSILTDKWEFLGLSRSARGLLGRYQVAQTALNVEGIVDPTEEQIKEQAGLSVEEIALAKDLLAVLYPLHTDHLDGLDLVAFEAETLERSANEWEERLIEGIERRRMREVAEQVVRGAFCEHRPFDYAIMHGRWRVGLSQEKVAASARCALITVSRREKVLLEEGAAHRISVGIPENQHARYACAPCHYHDKHGEYCWYCVGGRATRRHGWEESDFSTMLSVWLALPV